MHCLIHKVFKDHSHLGQVVQTTPEERAIRVFATDQLRNQVFCISSQKRQQDEQAIVPITRLNQESIVEKTVEKIECHRPATNPHQADMARHGHE
jgi:hypothetical protein